MNPHLGKYLYLNVAVIFLARHQHQFVQKLLEVFRRVESHLLVASMALRQEQL